MECLYIQKVYDFANYDRYTYYVPILFYFESFRSQKFKLDHFSP